ncbi:MAG: hypothetical protein ABFC67_12210 [Mizugakiibacter sp.]|uniref:hypothetical protein n=1 Tax=Mizugakiibacter sp. TaxID=1972610 RepID=UPI0031C0A078|nr:hypothetical protein [Xanthomonadaceae bacterium]
MNAIAAVNVDPQFLRHDLIVEMARVEMAIEDIRSRRSAAEQGVLLPALEQRRSRICAALSRLPA